MQVVQPGSTATVVQTTPVVTQSSPVIQTAPVVQTTQYVQPAVYQPATTVVAQPAQHTVVVAPQQRPPGSCPYCGGIVRDTFSQMGIIFAIILFPFGIILCFFMMEKRCKSCGR